MNNTLTLWEDTDLTEQWKKSESKPTFAPSDGINETKNVSVKSVCENTGNERKWMRSCPECHRNVSYTTEYGFRRAINRNRPCMSCITTSNNRTKKNYVGMEFGGLTIINQYYPVRGALKVDYKCKCGNVVIGRTFAKVKTQRMCIKCSTSHNGLKHGKASFNSLYDSYMRNAKRRSLEFKLTEDEFEKLTQQNCVYCGGSPNGIIRPKSVGAYVYNGIDRRDNTKGYTQENCVPCCKICNFAKHELTIDDFLNHIRKIYDHTFVEGRR